MKTQFSLYLIMIISLFSSCNDEQVFLSLDKNVAHMEINKTLILQAEVTAGYSGEVTWLSSNEEVATVLQGIVSAVGEGRATITASAGNASASCEVFVTQEGGIYYGEYELVWEEEFDGDKLDLETWNIEVGGHGWGNQEKQFYTGRNENLRVEDGNLVIEVKKESYENRDYTSARITTKGKKDFKYGKIEARISLPKGGGTWPAFWMMGYGSWPYCGEIDIMEHVGNRPNSIIHALHTQEKNGMNGSNWHYQRNGIENLEQNYHVFGIEWLQNYEFGRDAIRFYIDDQVSSIQYEPTVEVDLGKWPFNKEFFIILNVALGGTMGGSINNNIFDHPVIMKVDWVRVYQKKL